MPGGGRILEPRRNHAVARRKSSRRRQRRGLEYLPAGLSEPSFAVGWRQAEEPGQEDEEAKEDQAHTSEPGVRYHRVGKGGRRRIAVNNFARNCGRFILHD